MVGGGAGTPPRARGEDCSGQTRWMSGCPGVPMGTAGSNPHLARCEGSVQRAVPGSRQGSVPIGSAPWQKSASPLIPESRRHLRQRVVHGRPGQPIGHRRQSRQQERFRVKLESGGGLGWQVGQRCPPGWPGPLQSVSA